MVKGKYIKNKQELLKIICNNPTLEGVVMNNKDLKNINWILIQGGYEVKRETELGVIYGHSGSYGDIFIPRPKSQLRRYS